MSTQAEGDGRRDAALAVLTTGLHGDAIGERLIWPLIALVVGRPTQPVVFTADDLEHARALAQQHRVTNLASRLVPELRDNSVLTMASAISIERDLLETVDLLSRAGVPTLALKGNATAYLDHVDPANRQVGDVDLLVRPDQFEDAMHVLTRANYRRTVTHPFATPSFFHSETFVHPSGSEIDLHHRLAQPSRPPVSCWHEPDSFVLGGHTVLALPRAWRFVHALVHQLKDSPPTVRPANGLLDAVLMWSAGVDHVEVRSAAHEIGLSDLVERGLNRLADLLGESRPTPISVPESGWADRRLATALDSPHRTPGYLALVGNLAVQQRRRWPRYVRELIWPTKAYRDELGITLPGQIRHVAREAIGR